MCSFEPSRRAGNDEPECETRRVVSAPYGASYFSGGPFFWGRRFPGDSSDMGDFTPRFLGHQPPAIPMPLEESRAVTRRPRRRRVYSAPTSHADDPMRWIDF